MYRKSVHNYQTNDLYCRAYPHLLLKKIDEGCRQTLKNIATSIGISRECICTVLKDNLWSIETIKEESTCILQSLTENDFQAYFQSWTKHLKQIYNFR